MAREFSGTTEKITITRDAIFEPTGSVSIWCWMKRNGAQSSFTKIFGKTVNDNESAPFVQYMLEFNSSDDDNIVFTSGHDNDNAVQTATGNNITDGVWFFLGGSYSDSNNRSRVYYAKDGNALTQVETANTEGVLKVDTTDDIVIGGKGAADQEFKGDIAECGISNVELTEGEFQNIRIRGGHVARGFVDGWSLRGIASPEPDMAGKGHTASLSGNATADHPPVAPMFGFDFGWQGTFTAVAGGLSIPIAVYHRKHSFHVG